MTPPAVKKLSTLVSEPPSEPTPATHIIVIHPGSRYLRIGRASDSHPITVSHCIARRHKQPGRQQHYEDTWMWRPECAHADYKHQMKQGLRAAEEALSSRPKSNGEFRKPTQYKQLSALNSQRRADVTDIPAPRRWTDTTHKPTCLIGDEALFVDPSDSYNLYWPIRYGRFNLHTGANGSLTALEEDLVAIWTYALGKLDITADELRHYRAVLLIPDLYHHRHLNVYMDVLLTRLGFAAAFLHQESVCGTYGSGIATACIVDVGDQKTSVTCVEDGISYKETRLQMDYGSSDVARCLYWLLRRIALPYKGVNFAKRLDAMFLLDIKDQFCHMNQDITDVAQRHFQVSHPGSTVRKFTMCLGDERILAPMAYFYPDLFGMKADGLAHEQHDSDVGDAADIYDEFYLHTVQSSRKKDALDKNQRAETLGQEDSTLIHVPDEDSLDPTDALSTSDITSADRFAIGGLQSESRPTRRQSLPLYALDDAIFESIDRCESDEVKKRMYSCIIVVGGGFMYSEAANWLQYRIWSRMPARFRLQLETMDVLTKPKDLDPRFICWKGGSILACLDTSQELWIKQREWRKDGVKALREHAPFVW